MYKYYSEGFFGYGPPDSFRPYSLMHLVPLILCVGIIVLIWVKRDTLRNWKGEIHLRFVFSFVMFLMEFGYFLWLLYAGDDSGKNLMMSKLPLHVCDLGLICCMYMMPSKNRTLFGINYFVTLFGATLARIIPQTVLKTVNPGYYRYYQYFGEHLLPIIGTTYMMIVHGMRPRYRDIWISSGILLLMVVPSIFLNDAFPGSDYMFLRLEMSFMPQSQLLRAVIYYILINIIFHLMWLIWKLVQKKTEARA